MKNTKITAILFGTMLTLSLVGCASTTTSTADTSSEIETTVEATIEPTAEPTKEVVKESSSTKKSNSDYKTSSNSSTSRIEHYCESCSKEGTHSIVGFSGQTEYYCTQHYNEMVEILEMLFSE